MPTPKKAEVIEQATAWYQKSSGVIFTDYRGLKVKEIQHLRSVLKAKGAEIHVIKNTLFRKAIGDDAANLPDELNSGPTAVAFIYENEPDCAKALFDFAKGNKALEIKGGFFGGKPMNAAQIEALSKLPPRDQLIAQVIGTIAAPLTQLVGVIEALYADPIRVIGAVADKVAEGSPLPEPAPVAVEASAETPAEAAAPEVASDAPAEAPAEPVTEEATAPADESPAPAAEEGAPTPETPEEN